LPHEQRTMESAFAPNPRQTQSFLRRLLAQHGLHPKNKLGQNYLIDLNLLEVLLAAAELDSSDLVLEVGTGTGSLTHRLADHAGCVVGVEVDRDFFELVREKLGRPNVHLVC